MASFFFDILRIGAIWLAVSLVSVGFIARLFRHSKDPFDCFEDHDDNMDDEGGWK